MAVMRRDLVARIDGDATGFNKATKSAQQSASVFERELKKLEAQQAKQHAAMADLGTASMAAGVAMAAGVGLAIKGYADFDKAMSRVKAATHASAESMEVLRAAALEAGARTAFSAGEAASAIEELAKAGVSTADILGGGLNGALDLAAAGSMAVGEAAELAATALVQFGLSGAEVPHVADLLAAAAGKAQGSVSDMGAALNQSGLVASQMGLSIEETVGTLAAFASAGLLGSDAGTSFRTMLLRLANPTEKAAGAMQDIGLNVYDASGAFVGMESVAGQLAEGLGGVDEATRNTALATIFGSDAIRAASLLYKQGASGVQEWTASVNDAGYAQETAALLLDNLAGDLEALGGSIETALIKSGSGANTVLREMVQAATGAVNAYGALPSPLQNAATGLGAVSSAGLLAGGAFLYAVPKVAQFTEALAVAGPKTQAIAAGFSKVGSALMGPMGAALAAGTVALAMYGVERAKAEEAVRAFTDAIQADSGAVGENARQLAATKLEQEGVYEEAERLGISLDVVTEAALGNKDAMGQVKTALSDAGLIYHDMLPVIEDTAETTGKATEAARRNGEATAGAATGQTELAAGMEDVAGAAQEQTDSLAELMEAVQGLSDLVLGLRNASRGYEGALDAATAALKENGKTLDISTEKGRENEAALDAIAESAGKVLEQMVANGAPISDVTTKFREQREALIKAAEGFGMTREQAQEFAASVLRIPNKKDVEVSLTGAEAALSQVERLRQRLGELKNKTVTIRLDEVLGITVQRGVPGRIIERAGGGILPGQPSSVDNMLIAAATGEFVVNAKQTARYRGVLEAINSGTLPARASGGILGNRRSSSGPAIGSPGFDLLREASRLTSVEQVRALVDAWEDYIARLAEATRRQELLTNVRYGEQALTEAFAAERAARAERDRAIGTDDLAEAQDKLRRVFDQRHDAQRRLDDARRAVQDFDAKAQLDAEREAVASLVERMQDEADARTEAARAAQEQAEARQKAIDAAQDEADQALSVLNRLLDQEQTLRARDRDLVARHAEQAAQVRARQVQAEADYYTKRSALGVQFNAEQQQILDARRDALIGWAPLDQIATPAWGNTVEQLVGNAGAQLRQFEQWMAELDAARGRGVSEEVIAALGLDQGPQALGQLRQFNLATVGEIDALNEAVAQRSTLASEQTAREQQHRYGELGRALTDARAQYVLELDALQQEYLSTQQELDAQLADLQQELLADQEQVAAELAALGQEQGRAYGEALAAAMLSQVPAVLAAAQALKDAQAGVATATGSTGGVLDSPFKRIRTATYDSGGWLQPGYTLAYNGTGMPERVITARQTSGPTQVTVNARVFVGDREITDIVRVEVDGTLTSQRRAYEGVGSMP